MKTKLEINWLSLGVSLAFGAVFLYFSFRGIDIARLVAYMVDVHWVHLFAILVLAVLSIVLRGWRWWYTLPRPHQPGEFWAALRALAICYAFNLVLPRAGEVSRIVQLARATGRGYGAITGSVILDRVLLDVLVLAFFLLYAGFGFKGHLVAIFPSVEGTLNGLLFLMVLGIGAMVLFALRPGLFLKTLHLVGMRRWAPSLAEKLEELCREIAMGMSAIAKPRQVLVVLGMTLVLWGSYFASFYYGLLVFGIEASLGQAFFVYTITVIGFAIPSPGGVGTYHYFTKVALAMVLGTDEALGVALATVLHALMTLGAALSGVVALLTRKP